MTGMDSFDKIEAEVIAVTRHEDSDRLSAQVKLRFRLSEQQDPNIGEMIVCTELIERENYRWRRTKRRIIESAWGWLDRYFGGANLGSENENLFSDIFDDPEGLSDGGLTAEEEKSLQQELREIEGDVAA